MTTPRTPHTAAVARVDLEDTVDHPFSKRAIAARARGAVLAQDTKGTFGKSNLAIWL
jgi:hypothetical protein